MTPEQERELMVKSRNRMLERLMKAGWVKETAEMSDKFGIAWTPIGSEKAKRLKALFDELDDGKEIYAAELSALLFLIDKMSVAGGEDSEPHRL